MFLSRALFGAVERLCWVLGSFVCVVCHFVSCGDLGLFVSVCLFCFFAVIIMGCSLLLSHFLFIALILSSGSSLTSQGCLRCGNQGELYLLSVCSHLKTFDLIKVNCSIFLCQSLAVQSVFFFKKYPTFPFPFYSNCNRYSFQPLSLTSNKKAFAPSIIHTFLQLEAK